MLLKIQVQMSRKVTCLPYFRLCPTQCREPSFSGFSYLL